MTFTSAVEHDRIVFADVDNFSNLVCGVANLELLRDIENTCDSLGRYAAVIEPIYKTAFKLAKDISGDDAKPGNYLDEDEKAINAFANCIVAFSAHVAELRSKEAFIDQDAGLNAEHREVLHAAYERAIAATEFLVAGNRDLIDAIIQHDLDAEPTPDVSYTSASELIAELKRSP